MRVFVVAAVLALSGCCHRYHAVALDVPHGPQRLGRVVAAVTSAADAAGMEAVSPEQDVTGGWWEPQLVCAFGAPDTWALGLWVELGADVLVVRLQQIHGGWAESPQYRAALDQLRVGLVAALPGVRVREGSAAWERRRPTRRAETPTTATTP